ncbi:efflux RND transporter periplasmic adaptor subunit [Candidatus Dependentiae bacterium]|nr:efflux RND transporter periplasmic adaptor subunit [Candidatus Dependentiae bacterium]
MKTLKKMFLFFASVIIIVAVIKIFPGNDAANKHSGKIEKAEHLNHTDGKNKNGQIWTCSMHPQIKRNTPGKCPICGMELILAHSDDIEVGLNQISFSESAVKLAEIMTDTVKRRNIDYEMRVTGKINYNETLFKVISAWISGRLEKIYINFTGESVKKGDPLALIYSPELYAAQVEFIESLKLSENAKYGKSGPNDGNKINLDLAGAAREKLKLLGLSDAMIKDIEIRGAAETHFKVISPVSGVVIKRNATEGMYVEAGMALYEIADLTKLWALCDVYESDLNFVKKGQRMEFTTEAYPGEKFKGIISFVDPVIDPMARTAKIRVDIDNIAGKLKPEMFVRAIVKSNSHQEKELVIPASAPLITGNRAVVYVELFNNEKPVYEGREVVLGRKAGNYYSVISGLREGEKVVTNGNFKIDSAMQIQAKPSMMNKDGGIKSVDNSGHTKLSGKSGVASIETAHQKQEQSINKKNVLKHENQNELNSIFKIYFKLQEQLAADNIKQSIAEIKKLAVEINLIKKNKSELYNNFTQIFEDFNHTIAKLSSAENIEGLRTGFKNLSQLFIKLEKETGYYNITDYYKVYCPMAFDGKGAEWLQNNVSIKNPYLGKAMESCGEIKK